MYKVKLATLAYKIFHDCTPPSMGHILTKKTSPIHHLRTTNMVTVPHFNTYFMKNSIAFRASILGFHMTSRSPCWCPQTMKWRPCWCPDPILWELKAIIMLTSSFVFVEKHGCWSCEWNPRIVWNLLTPHLAKTSNVKNYTRMASKSDKLRN